MEVFIIRDNDLDIITNTTQFEGGWTVYAHVNKINGKIYIGITGKKPSKRWGKNGCLYRREKQPAFYNAIKKYGWDGFKHIELINNISEEMAKIIESELIKKYHTCVYDENKNGYNMDYGGALTRTGISASDDTKNKMSISHKGEKNCFYGKHHTPETKKLLSEINKIRNYTGENNPFYGKRHTEEVKKRMSELASKRTGSKNPNYGKHTLKGRKGHPLSDEAKQRISKTRRERKSNCKQTYCFNNNKIYESALQAAKETGVCSTEVSRCCTGKIESTKGYRFCYLLDNE